MYKNLIIGLALIFATFSGFYMIKAGGGELIKNAFVSTDGQMTLNSPTIENVVGIYKCSIKTGCRDKYVMMLREDQTIEFLSSNDPSNEEELKAEEEELTLEEALAQDSTIEPTPQVERSSIVFLDGNTTAEDLPPTQFSQESTSTTTEGEPSTLETTSSGFADEEDQLTEISSLSELEEASKAVVEKGTWAFGGGNILIITLTTLGDTEYNTPQKLIIKNISASTLSGITFNRDRYKEMVKPVFVKVE